MMALLDAPARQPLWRRFALPLVVCVVLVAGAGVAWRVTHAAPVDRHSALAPQVVLATRTAVEAHRATDGAVLWHAPFADAGVVSGAGLVLVTEPDQATVHLLDARDGNIRWTRTLGGDIAQHRLGADTITPDVIVLRGTIVDPDGTYHMYLAGLATSDGHVAWRYHEDNVMRADLRLIGDTLLVADHAFVGIVHDISLSALNPKDGSVRWRHTERAEHYNILVITGDTLLVRIGGLVAFDLATGHVRWATMPYAFGVTACVAGDVVYANFYASGFNVVPDSQSGMASYRLSNGAVLWQRSLQPLHYTNVLACNGAAVTAVQRVDAPDDHTTTRYRLRGNDGAPLAQAPEPLNIASIDGMPDAFLLANDDSVALQRTDATAPQWRTTVPHVTNAPPILLPQFVDGNLYVQRSDARANAAGKNDTFYALDPATGAIRWQVALS